MKDKGTEIKWGILIILLSILGSLVLIYFVDIYGIKESIYNPEDSIVTNFINGLIAVFFTSITAFFLLTLPVLLILDFVQKALSRLREHGYTAWWRFWRR